MKTNPGVDYYDSTGIPEQNAMTKNSTEIQFATIADATVIAQLSKTLIEHGLVWKWTTEAIVRAIRDKTTNVIVAKNSGALAGFGIMKYEDAKANLHLLAIKPEFRRVGLGTQIVRWLEKVASTAGIFHIYVQLRQRNLEAKNFYMHLGYEIIDVAQGYYEGIENAVIMYHFTGSQGDIAR